MKRKVGLGLYLSWFLLGALMIAAVVFFHWVRVQPESQTKEPVKVESVPIVEKKPSVAE